MIRASAGTWANYATTVVFQVLFAAAFGASANASAFVIAFSIAIAASGTLVTAGLTVHLPRMLTEEGHFARRALLAVGALAGIGIVAAISLAVLGLVGAVPAAMAMGSSPAVGRQLLLTAAALLLVLTVAGLLGVVALARGNRFLPAFAPAFPSILGATYLALATRPQVTETLLAMTAGAVVQALLAAYVAFVPRRAIADTPPLGSRSLAGWSIALFAALNTLAPLQRLLASSMDASGAAQYDYGARGLQVVMQLLLGGLVISSLPDWTTMRQDVARMRVQVMQASASAFLLLVVAVSVAVVAIEPAIALVLQRGAFGPDDTAAVALLVVILLPGFVGEGLTLVLTQALLATRLTRQFLWINGSRFFVHAVLTVVLGLGYGAVGVAAAYSISLAMTAVLTSIAAIRSGLVHWNSGFITRVGTVAGATLGAALLLSFLKLEWTWVSAATVLAVAATGAYVLRLQELIPPVLQRMIPRLVGPA